MKTVNSDISWHTILYKYRDKGKKGKGEIYIARIEIKTSAQLVLKNFQP